ncbi:hypothetical protein AC630_12830 [Bradyrhizobium sp. AS23.2]|nr:hypothetical protein AC630_12830 [Bradyrhizobium sp. AS23.2]
MLLIAGSISTGLVLGLRYRVFILLPAILVGALAISAVSPQPLWQAWTSVLTFAVLLQISYVAGALLRFATSSGVTANVPGELSRARSH